MARSHFDRFYESRVISSVFPNLLSELRIALRDCDEVLDIGFGPASPVSRCGSFNRTVGVEPFAPYLKQAREKSTHTELVGSNLFELDFPPKSFDAVVLIDVIEHMSAEDALSAIGLARRWAKKRVIVTTPNGYIPQSALDNNPLQVHLSGWKVDDLKQLGFKSRGLAGPKWLRQEVPDGTMGGGILTSIRLKPRPFWFIVATLLQPFTYRFPRFAFSQFAVLETS